jgi:PAS domain S-box-containing protein
MPTPTPSSCPPPPDACLSITELIDLKKLQQIQDAFAGANQVASSLIDVTGVLVTKPSNHSKVCDMIRATEKGLKNCMLSGKELGRQAHEKKKSIHQQCASIGFIDAAAPIIVNGRHIANWLIGQYHVGNVDAAHVRKYAEEIGTDPEEMVREFEKMPKLSREDFEKKLVFLQVMTDELSLMAYQKLMQQQQNVELNHIKKELEKYQSHLKNLVEERTAALQQANQQLTAEIEQKTTMQERQNRLVTAIKCAAESIVITSLRGEIIFVNPAFEKLTGYSADEVIDKSPKILQSGAHDEGFYRDLWQTILAGRVWVGRFTNRKKDGTTYLEEATISPVRDEQGKIINFVAVKKDITKEVALERQLNQAQKLESIGILAAGMAHEINTPIQYLLSNTEFLREVRNDLAKMQTGHDNLINAVSAAGAFGDEVAAINRLAEELDLAYLTVEADKALLETLEGIHRISTIVTAMKAFAQPESAEKQPENLHAIIENTIDVSRSQWQNVAELELCFDAELPSVPLMAGRFKQVLLDMIINASYAMAEKYPAPAQRKGRITITTNRVADKVELHLADTGTGIPQRNIDKIFDPFFTTKPVGQGSGQGLSVAHGIIVDLHGGTISVASTEGEGTAFTITLPLKKAVNK